VDILMVKVVVILVVNAMLKKPKKAIAINRHYLGTAALLEFRV
jgi:hypothetical protein